MFFFFRSDTTERRTFFKKIRFWLTFGPFGLKPKGPITSSNSLRTSRGLKLTFFNNMFNEGNVEEVLVFPLAEGRRGTPEGRKLPGTDRVEVFFALGLVTSDPKSNAMQRHATPCKNFPALSHICKKRVMKGSSEEGPEGLDLEEGIYVAFGVKERKELAVSTTKIRPTVLVSEDDFVELRSEPVLLVAPTEVEGEPKSLVVTETPPTPVDAVMQPPSLFVFDESWAPSKMKYNYAQQTQESGEVDADERRMESKYAGVTLEDLWNSAEERNSLDNINMNTLRRSLDLKPFEEFES